MSYTNEAGQTVNVGDRVAYAGYMGHLYLGKVVSFTPNGNPRVELEGKFVEMVRNQYRHKQELVKHSGANIWDRRPGTHYRHKETGILVTRHEVYALPWQERSVYEYDKGLLGSEWIEFQVPYVVAIVKRSHVFVIEAADVA